MRRLLHKITKNSRSPEDGIFFKKINAILGFEPKDLRYYQNAFTHRSVNKMDDKGNPFNYERLEFLGDAMLGCVIAAHLYNEVPSGDEGYLTKMRSKIVSREHLNELGRDFNLVGFVDSKVSSNQYGENIHGNLFEAAINHNIQVQPLAIRYTNPQSGALCMKAAFIGDIGFVQSLHQVMSSKGIQAKVQLCEMLSPEGHTRRTLAHLSQRSVSSQLELLNA